MSNHRFELDVKFSIYGEEFEWDASLNWAPDDYTGVDKRITDWFANCYARARSGYDGYVEMRRAEDSERREREQLAYLKAKYESPQTQNEAGAQTPC